jgi:hypothetical protein
MQRNIRRVDEKAKKKEMKGCEEWDERDQKYTWWPEPRVRVSRASS